MDAGLLFQNAKVKSRESGLLGKDRLQRISDAATVDRIIAALADLAACPPGPAPTDGDFHE